jgi:hypothetical protein
VKEGGLPNIFQLILKDSFSGFIGCFNKSLSVYVLGINVLFHFFLIWTLHYQDHFSDE